MYCEPPLRAGWRLMLFSTSCLLFAGCGRNDTVADAPPTSVGQSDVPLVTESLEEIRAQMSALVQVQGERHVISSPEEFDAWRMKALITLDEIRRRDGVEGFRQQPVEKTGNQQAVPDSATGKIAWRASTCWNPQCLGKGKGGGPLLFTRTYDNAWVDTDGKLKWKTIADDQVIPATVCPLCGLVEFVRPYDLPEVELRRQELTDELVNSRRIRAEREAAGQLVPAGVRTPTEIMRELNELPKLFLAQ